MKELGGFTLERQLGRGATAQVFLAHNKSAHAAPVALKVFHPGLWDREELKRRAVAEFHAVSVLRHPNIVQMLEPFWDLEPPAVALEFIDGASLEEFQRRLPYILPEVAVLVVIEVLSALEHAHAAGIIHRDLKPANILVSHEGRVCVSDFGLAKMTDASRLTLSGTILGSPDFMSPEQARGDVTTPRSDLFSAAAILYFLVTGTKPFSRHSPLATLAAVCEAQPEPAQRRNPKLSSALAAIIRKGLAQKPENRFASALEFKESLSQYLAGFGLFPERFNLPLWLRSPTDNSLEAMRWMADALIARAEGCLERAKADDFLETVSHLSQVAPESGAIPRLMENFENRKRKAVTPKTLAWILGGVMLAVGVIATSFMDSKQGPPAGPAENTGGGAQAKPVEPAARAVTAIARRSAPQVSHLPSVMVQFDVDPAVKVFWDGKRIDPSKPLKNQAEGYHALRLEKPGETPIRQTVQVSSQELNLIRVR